MSGKLTARHVGDVNIEQACAEAEGRTRHGTTIDTGSLRADALLHRPLPRDVPEAEPVDVTGVNGRVPEAWEQDEIRAAFEMSHVESS